MLIIRESQMIELQRSINRSFAAQAASSLLLGPSECLDRDANARLDVLTDLVGEAQSFAFKLDRSILAYMDIVLLMGPSFMARNYCQWLVTSGGLREDEKVILLIAYAERLLLLENDEDA